MDREAILLRAKELKSYIETDEQARTLFKKINECLAPNQLPQCRVKGHDTKLVIKYTGAEGSIGLFVWTFDCLLLDTQVKRARKADPRRLDASEVLYEQFTLPLLVVAQNKDKDLTNVDEAASITTAPTVAMLEQLPLAAGLVEEQRAQQQAEKDAEAMSWQQSLQNDTLSMSSAPLSSEPTIKLEPTPEDVQVPRKRDADKALKDHQEKLDKNRAKKRPGMSLFHFKKK
ncbi:hypothetical protein BC940DRAFT_255918 [Gongronella butleri]|nr:hypothetical protein BC940DRAFT_255918 [Gongronella butleri]